jgi:hypothetical protein
MVLLGFSIPLSVWGDPTTPPISNAKVARTSNAPSFAAHRTFTTGTHPYSVAAIDVNGDGKPDLLVVNRSDDTVSVLLNTTAPGATTPSFAPQRDFATGSDPRWVTPVDINGDNKPDLIVADSHDTVWVLLNTTSAGAATPSFAPQRTFATGAVPVSVTAVDVNGDGKPDLVVVNRSDDTVSVLLNTTSPGATTPSFAPQQTFATGARPNSVMAVDVNGDGKPDLIVANRSDNTVSVLLNTTRPGATMAGFAPQQTFATGSRPRSVTAADINGDGKPDLIVVDYNYAKVSVLLNTTSPGATTPSFAAERTFATGIHPYSVAAVDVNGDRKPDLIVTNYGVMGKGKSVSVLLNTTSRGGTTPSFIAPRNFATGDGPVSITAADINGDGTSDLIVANYWDGTVSVLSPTPPIPMRPRRASLASEHSPR